MAGPLRILYLGSPSRDGARLRSDLRLPASALTVERCSDPERAFVLAQHAPFDALLVGELGTPRTLQALTRLSELDSAPVFAVVSTGRFDAHDWAPLLDAGADGVLRSEDFRAPSLIGVLRYNIARAQAVRDERRTRHRLEVAHAAVAGLARVRTRTEFEEVAVDAVAALTGGCCALSIADEDDLVLVGARGLDDARMRVLARLTVALSTHPSAVAARLRRAVFLPEHDLSTRGLAPAAAGCVECAFPLLGDDRLLGVVWLEFPHGHQPTGDDRRALEQVVEHLSASLARAMDADALREHEQFAQRMIAVAAHDLRSPLQVISMAAELLATPATVAPSKQPFVGRIRESARRATDLVTQLLTVTGAQHGTMTSNPTRADAFSLLSDCVEDFRLRAPESVFQLSVSGSGSAQVDPNQFIQVVHNLLANAVHYREAGSVIAVHGTGASDRVYVEINNRGPAILDAQMAELFAPMKRGATHGESGSLGLGLYIARMLIEGMGGRIWARSTESEGNTFVIELRRDGATRSSTTSERPRPHASSRPPPGEISENYRRMLACMPDGGLSLLLRHWLELGGSTHLPHPHQLDRSRLLAHLPDMFWVDVLAEHGEHPRFRFTEMGGVLERRLEGRRPSLVTQVSSHAAIRPSLLEAYSRCVHSARPVFDYLRRGPSHPNDEQFARLVLPFSRDGRRVTQLIGMAQFRGFDEAVAAPEPATTRGNDDARPSRLDAPHGEAS